MTFPRQLRGPFGGGVWAIERASGQPDVITMQDYRLLLGLERKKIGGFGAIFEIGFVFGRQLKYHETNTPDFNPDPTMLVRAGLNY